MGNGVAGTARRILHGPSLVWTLPAMSGEGHTEGGRGKYNAPPANPFAFTANMIPAALRFSPGASAPPKPATSGRRWEGRIGRGAPSVGSPFC